MAKYHTIPTVDISEDIHLRRVKEPESVLHFDDKAIRAMLDLDYVKVSTIASNQRMYDARQLMQSKQDDMHLIFVLNDTGKLVGCLSLERIMTELPITLSEQERVRREEILVKHVMRPISEVLTMHEDYLNFAKVGDVIQTFKEAKKHYALVVRTDETTHEQEVCGLILASYMSKQLGIDVVSDRPDNVATVAELNRILKRKAKTSRQHGGALV